MPELTVLTAAELSLLDQAAEYLERPRFLMKVANLVGKPAESLLRVLPARAEALIGDASQAALARGLQWAVRSLPGQHGAGWPVGGGPRFHMVISATTGAVGGLFGLAGAAVELPATTLVMLRSIAAIAQRSGADLRDSATRLQCLAVFSLGSPTLTAMESAYYSSRLGTELLVRDAAGYLARHGIAEIGESLSRHAATPLARLLQQIAGRFQTVVTEKAAAQAVPILGAALGSLINAAFCDHFNRVAQFHFAILALERQHGSAAMQAAYAAAVARVRRR